MIGTTISHYKILDKLGEGGMGVVYKAHDNKLDRTVALKFLPEHLTKSDEDRKRFYREAKAAAALNHPHICTIYSVDEFNGMQFIVMEYIDGVTLRQRSDLSAKGSSKAEFESQKSAIPAADTKELKTIVDYAIQIAEALADAHETGIVHRDIKPDNIMVDSKNRIKVMDFGLAKLKDSVKITKPQRTLGSLGYMSPEHLSGKDIDNRSDIFSFGIVLYEMITGKLPFDGNNEAAVITSILNKTPDPLYKLSGEIPATLQHIVNRCLEKNPTDRYQSMRDVIVDLRRIDPASASTKYASLKEMAVVNIGDSNKPPRLSGKEAGSAKNIGRWLLIGFPIVLMVILLIVLIPRAPVSTPPEETVIARSYSIAVLPFDNLSPDPENEYFADGMTEDIITQLSKIGTFNVISRTSVMQYKGTSKNIREIGRELGANIILEGSVRRAGDRLRIVSQLIDATTDNHLWAETYDREIQDIFRIQSEVAQSIATALRTRLTPEEKELISREPTANFAAYQLYLKGREHFYRYTHDDNETAIDYYLRALELDSTFALAYAGIADAYNQRKAKFWYPVEVLDTSIQFSEKALALDPQLAEAYKSLGQAYDLSHRYYKALYYYEKSMEINPNYWPAVSGFSNANFTLGRLDLALPAAKKSVALAPNNMYGSLVIAWIYQRLECDSLAYTWFNRALDIEPGHPFPLTLLSEHYLYMNEIDKARKNVKQLIEKNPDWVLGYFMAGRVETTDRNYQKASEYFELLHTIAQTNPEYYYGYTLLKTGDEDRGMAIIQNEIDGYLAYFEATADENSLNEFSIANMYAIKGDRENALAWLRTAIDKGWVDFRRLYIEPYFEDLLDDSTLQSYVREMQTKVQGMRMSLRQQYPDLICYN